MRRTLMLGLIVAAAMGCSQGVTPMDASGDSAVTDAGTDVGTTTDVIAPSDVPTGTDVIAPSDVPAPQDVPVASDTGPVGDAGACVFGGVYSLTFMGQTVYFRFSADGSWQGAQTADGFDMPDAFQGTWALSGTRVTIHDGAAGTDGGSAGCPPDQEGAYDAVFAADCSVTLHRVTDACTSRGMFLDGQTFTPVTP